MVDICEAENCACRGWRHALFGSLTTAPISATPRAPCSSARESALSVRRPIALRRLRCYEDLHPDVALVDIDLGGEDGFALAEQLDRASTASALAVILVSTYDESDLAEMIDASPAVGFLQKFSLSPDAIRDLVKVTAPQGR